MPKSVRWAELEDIWGIVFLFYVIGTGNFLHSGGFSLPGGFQVVISGGFLHSTVPRSSNLSIEFVKRSFGKSLHDESAG